MKTDQPAGQKFANLGDPLVGGHLIGVNWIRDIPDGESTPILSRQITKIAMRINSSPSNFLGMRDHVGCEEHSPGTKHK